MLYHCTSTPQSSDGRWDVYNSSRTSNGHSGYQPQNLQHRLVATAPQSCVIVVYCTDKIDFMRDVIAYIVVLVVIIAVAYDGTVT